MLDPASLRRRLVRLTDAEVQQCARELRAGPCDLRTLNLFDYDSLVRIRVAVQRTAWRDNRHAKALAEEAA